ncbi:MAG: [ribosomal protein S18]-alanine N-acetyltransferase [Acidobacteriota bacterium]|jgi:ribosomal-protein-alanine acetyltransferase|nr:[ribosomal protein S18]-alanine N-acetyltransferase [Acidobacteriota bacterium]
MSTQLSPSLFPYIRTARPEDVERIFWLEQIGFPDPWPRELLAYEIHHPMSAVLVAVWADGLPAAGYASFRRGGGEAELLRLAVAPGERRRGVARALVAGGIERLRSAGIETCFLEVRTNNEGAIAFYREMGFERVGRRPAYYKDGSDALVYARRVAPP